MDDLDGLLVSHDCLLTGLRCCQGDQACCREAVQYNLHTWEGFGVQVGAPDGTPSVGNAAIAGRAADENGLGYLSFRPVEALEGFVRCLIDRALDAAGRYVVLYGELRPLPAFEGLKQRVRQQRKLAWLITDIFQEHFRQPGINVQSRQRGGFLDDAAQLGLTYWPEVDFPVVHGRAEVRIVARLGIKVCAYSDDDTVPRVIAADERQQAPDERPARLLLRAQGMEFLHLVDYQEQRRSRRSGGEHLRDLRGGIFSLYADWDTGPAGDGICQLPDRIGGGRDAHTVITGL